MLINDLGWRGEAALQCGFVDITLEREGMKHSPESFSQQKHHSGLTGLENGPDLNRGELCV